jgi:urea carboxylase
MIEVVQSGLLTTIQDLGRNGYQAYGVPRSGALDPFLASIANKLVGNPFGRPLLEFALVGPTLHFNEETWISIVAFSCEYEADGAPVPEFSATRIAAGSTLEFKRMDGWFGYLAVNGGIATTPVLGSASTYLAGQLGDRLHKGQLLPTGLGESTRFSVREGFLGFRDSSILPVLPALHTDLFTEHERHNLADEEYTITMHSNRMGIYLEGAPIEPPAVRRSVPAFPGVIQIPPSRRPIILGPEGPTTGGYPQIGMLSKMGWTKLAQLRPGKAVRFEWIETEQAQRIWSYRNRILETSEAWETVL